jgi:RNA polymerase sigma-70 factor, ECF subfamily
VAKNHAIDYVRRHGREILADPADLLEANLRQHTPRLDEVADGRQLLERFRERILPPKWRPVFEACFVRQLTQREAAEELGLARTTLLYQQHRIRALLRSFLLEAEE